MREDVFDFSHLTKDDLTPEFIREFFLDKNGLIRTSRAMESFLKKNNLYEQMMSLYETRMTIVEIIYTVLGEEEKLKKYRDQYRYTYTGKIPETADEVTDEFLIEFFVKTKTKHTHILNENFYIINRLYGLYEIFQSLLKDGETIYEFVVRRLGFNYLNPVEPYDGVSDFREYILKNFFYSNGARIKGRTTASFLKKYNAYDAAMSYYPDCESIDEFFYRIINNIDVRPVCEHCGKKVSFVEDGKHSKHFSRFCSHNCYVKGFDFSSRREKLSHIEQKSGTVLTIEDLKNIGVIVDGEEPNYSMMTEFRLKKFGLYDIAMKLSDDSKYGKVILQQVAYKVINGDYKFCKICGKVIENFYQNKFAETCSAACNGKLQSKLYQEKFNITIRDIYSDDKLEQNLEIYNKYKDTELTKQFVEQMQENKHKNKVKKIKRVHKVPLIEYWKERGLTLKLDYEIEIVNGEKKFKKWITVKNCCSVHGDCTFDEVNFQNRARRRDAAPMCLKCNPLNNREKTGIELIVEDILKEIGVKYEYENKNVCRPYDVDFYLPDHHIGFEVNGVHWHSDIKHYERHIQKMHIASKNNVNIYFLWEDDIVHRREEVKQFILTAMSGKRPEYIHPEDSTAEYFFVNSHSFERTYNVDDIMSEPKSWELCYVIRY